MSLKRRWRLLAAGVLVSATAAAPAQTPAGTADSAPTYPPGGTASPGGVIASPYDNSIKPAPAAAPRPAGAPVQQASSWSQAPAGRDSASCSTGKASWWQRCTAGGTARAPKSCNPSWWQRWRACWGSVSESYHGYPEEYDEPPLGTFVYAHGEAMVANGDAARLVLYDYDFVDCGDHLNDAGRERLARLACLLAETSCPLVVERLPGGQALSEARRAAVLAELGQLGYAVPPERVVVASPLNKGLRGVEAEVIYGNLIQNTQTRGLLSGTGDFPTGVNIGGNGSGSGTAGGAPYGGQQ